jgi:hypothetical protein
MSIFQDFLRISPFLWFSSNAEEAVEFYLSVFKDSRRLDEAHNERNRFGHLEHRAAVGPRSRPEARRLSAAGPRTGSECSGKSLPRPERIKNPKTFEAMRKMKRMDIVELERGGARLITSRSAAV